MVKCELIHNWPFHYDDKCIRTITAIIRGLDNAVRGTFVRTQAIKFAPRLALVLKVCLVAASCVL